MTAHVRMEMRTVNTHIRFHSFALFVLIIITAYWDAYRCHHNLQKKKKKKSPRKVELLVQGHNCVISGGV